MTDKRLNILPVPTWNRLRVNAAGPEFELPELPAQTQGARAEEKGAEAALESGIGAYFDAYVREHADGLRSFCGSSTGGAPLQESVCLTASEPLAVRRCRLSAEAGETLSLLQTVRSDGKTAGDASVLTEIHAKAHSHIRLFQVVTAGEESKVRLGVSVQAEEDAKVEIFRAVMGGGAAALGVRAALSKPRAEFTLHTVYFASGKQKLDFNDIAEHTAGHTASELYTAGVLSGQSEKTLRGTIDFRPGASGAVGHESEDVLLLGNEVINKCVPLILCGEENVEGQHAASSGRPDERQLYYLTTRGLSREEATRLLIRGRFAPVLDRIPDETVRRLLLDEVERRLSEDDCMQ